MRTSLFVAALAALGSVAAHPAPNVDVSRTSVDLDASKEALDRGDIALHITRTDDLYSDSDDAQELLLSRFTHIKLEIQLDAQKGCIRVNNEELALTGQPNGDATLAYVKAEALRMPVRQPSCMVTPDTLEKLEAQMSPGIVSLEVRLEADINPVNAAVVHENKDHDLVATPIDGVSIRRLGLFVKITEVEGVEQTSLTHSSLVYAPILQLIVKSKDEEGHTIYDIETLAVNGHAPVETLPGPAIAGQVDGGYPVMRPHHGGFLGRLANLLGFDDSCEGHHSSHPHHGSESDAPVGRHHSMATARRGGRHGHCGRNRHLSTPLAYTGSVLAALWSTLVCKILAGIAAGALLFHSVRRFVCKKKRCCRNRGGDEYSAVMLDDETLAELEADELAKEKNEVAVDMSHVINEPNELPPAYLEQHQQNKQDSA